MSDFIHSEAEESEDEEELTHHDKKKLKKLKAMEESDDDEDEDDDEDDDDDEEEEKMREELRDLIDDDPIEEDDDDSDISRRSDKRRRSEDEFDDRLEDDDYDLIEENLGVKLDRKRFKRVQKMVDEESEGEAVDGDEREAIAHELFEGSGDEEDKRYDQSNETAEPSMDDGGSEGESSDADDFIVHDDGRPIRNKRRKKKHIFADSALQEAQDIFGIDFDYAEFKRYEDEEGEEEDEDEYEDERESNKQRRSMKQIKKDLTRKSIFEIYEPSELRRGHFTDQDNEIRITDIPERMQLRTVPIKPVEEGSDELDHEAKWIYEQAFCKPSITIQDANLNEEAKERARETINNGPQTINKIKNALDFLRNQYFEVPFISFYRKEYVLPELNINDLWKVYKFDAKWCQLRQRKEDLLKLFQKMMNYQSDKIMKDPNALQNDDSRIIKDEDVARLKSCQTSEELNDIYHHFKLYYSHDIEAMQESERLREREIRKKERFERRERKIAEGREDAGEAYIGENSRDEDNDEADKVIKKPVRNDLYSICRKAGLGPLAKMFGLTPEQFGENLRDNYQRHEVEQEPTEPTSVAQKYTGQKFKTSEEVLKAAQLMVAVQLAREPLVLKTVRDMYMERAKLSVRPTKSGMKEIDENHPIYSMKYLKDKPVKDLIGDQFLKLVVAEQDKLITISLGDTIEGNSTNNYIEEVKQLYYRDEFSKTVQDWNALRMESVEMALTKLIIPNLKKELRSALLSEARESVMHICCRKMYNWLKIAPYSCEFPDEDDDWDTSKGLRVMGVAYILDESQAPFACLVSPESECTDFLKLTHLLKRKNSYKEAEKVLKEADLLTIRNFIATKKPHLVVIGGESKDALMIQTDIQDIITSLVTEEQFPVIPVEICDNELAKVFANSNRGENEFRDYSLQLRQAISLARRMQDPLLEFSQLCTPDNEILCLKFHPLQNQLSPEDLMENICIEVVNRVNEVGVDINRAVQQFYFSSVVQFVCGLGPRKGQALLKILKQTNQRLENRTQLVTICHMGPKVFINCAGFIKIDTNSLGDSTEAYVEVLDGCRVHPETYEWARKMAVDALEYDDKDANPAGALEEILETPERLKDLDLDAFAVELDRQGFGNKSITLYDIRAELSSRYKDLRMPFQSPNPEQLFDMLTKETMETFFTGKLILAKVIGITYKKPPSDQLDHANPVRNDETGLWQCPFCLKNNFPELSDVWNHFDAGSCPGKAIGVRLILDNGILGYIHIKNLSDKHVDNPSERVAINQPIHCRIIRIDVHKFSVECTSKGSDLADQNQEFKTPKDPYYDTEAEEKELSQEEELKKSRQRQTYIKRVIVHPSFHNISYAEAENIMHDLKQGDAIIRPSSKGADHLTVTWKVTDNIHQHIDVREEGKTNDFSLGSRLFIGDEEFEDLDEIVARHVNPMAAHVAEILDFKYYEREVGGTKEKAEEVIRAQKRVNPGGIPYIFSAVKNLPGKFLLSYLPRANCRHEYVSVTAKGFKFRSQIFGRLPALIKWFKKHFGDPIPGIETPSTPRSIVSSRATPYTATPGGYMTGMTQEAIQRVAQSMPSHMLNSLTQVANQKLYQTQSPITIYGGMSTYPSTPYTPSSQSPFQIITPYQTPQAQFYHPQPLHAIHGSPMLIPLRPAGLDVSPYIMSFAHESTPNISSPAPQQSPFKDETFREKPRDNFSGSGRGRSNNFNRGRGRGRDKFRLNLRDSKNDNDNPSRGTSSRNSESNSHNRGSSSSISWRNGERSNRGGKDRGQRDEKKGRYGSNSRFRSFRSRGPRSSSRTRENDGNFPRVGSKTDRSNSSKRESPSGISSRRGESGREKGLHYRGRENSRSNSQKDEYRSTRPRSPEGQPESDKNQNKFGYLKDGSMNDGRGHECDQFGRGDGENSGRKRRGRDKNQREGERGKLGPSREPSDDDDNPFTVGSSRDKSGSSLSMDPDGDLIDRCRKNKRESKIPLASNLQEKSDPKVDAPSNPKGDESFNLNLTKVQSCHDQISTNAGDGSFSRITESSQNINIIGDQTPLFDES